MNDLYSTFSLHILESTIWVILFLLFAWLLRIRDARMLCWIYRASLLKFLIPTTLLSNWITLSESQNLISDFVVSAESVKSVVYYAAKQPEFIWPAYIWSVGIFAFVILAAWTGVRVHNRIQKGSTPFSGRYLRILRQTLMDAKGASKELPGTLVVQGPPIALYGIFRPRIIAKHAFLETLDDNELTSALQHEAAHWIRRDNLWRLLTDAITAILWDHPLIWFIRHRLMLETEKACDETVLSFGRPVTCYANCLLKAAEFSQERIQFGAIALSETSLKQR
ncbi:MAG: M56 family metallopeptidase [Verrucomicrobiae bacterium]|nr:M56 family metallopeptidase [Verrucomicrobiae bacterium]